MQLRDIVQNTGELAMPVADKVNQALASNDFGIVCLQLCEASYLPIGQIPDCVCHVNPLTPKGRWHVTWAGQDSYDTNLAFVALYYKDGETKPDQAALAIRGTDIDEWDIWGILWQMWEDLDFLVQVPVKWAPEKFQNAAVAHGTMEGTDEILSLQQFPRGESLIAYLTKLVNEGLPLTVTGHSLGGCLATVVASKLRGKIFPHAQIQPVTFAAPSAGNQCFANYFQSQFSNALIYASSLDIAPKSWGNLLKLDTIYSRSVGRSFSTPDSVLGTILIIEALLALQEINYAQPTLTCLVASLDDSVSDWYAEAFHQHHPSSYMQWLKGKDICITKPTMVSSGKPTSATLRAKLGPLPEVVAKLRSCLVAMPTT
jgi:lipase (class 3)